MKRIITAYDEDWNVDAEVKFEEISKSHVCI